MGRGQNETGSPSVARRTDPDLERTFRLQAKIRQEAPRVASLGNWPSYINVEDSLVGRVPIETPASGFDAGIACALDYIPRHKQKLAASLHAAYTPEAVEQVRQEVKKMNPDSETTWWLAACSICTEGKLTAREFNGQVKDFVGLVVSPQKRQEAAQKEFAKMKSLYRIENGVPFGEDDGVMQGAYIAGYDVAAMYDPNSQLYFIGTFRETLGLESFPWSAEVDEQGRNTSGPVHGSKQFVKAKDKEEYLRVLEALKQNSLL